MEMYIVLIWVILFITLFLISYVRCIQSVYEPNFKDYVCELVPSLLLSFIGTTLTVMVASCITYGLMYILWWIL